MSHDGHDTKERRQIAVDGEELHVLASLERLTVQLALAIAAIPRTLLTCIIAPRLLMVHLHLPDDARSRPVVVQGLLSPGLYALLLLVASAFIVAPVFERLQLKTHSDGASLFGPEQVKAISNAMQSGETFALFSALLPIFLFIVLIGYILRPMRFVVGDWWGARASFGAAAYISSTLTFVVVVLIAALLKDGTQEQLAPEISNIFNVAALTHQAYYYAALSRGPLYGPIKHTPMVWWRAVLSGIAALVMIVVGLTVFTRLQMLFMS